MRQIILTTFILALLQSCYSKRENFDASGSFEADEVIVSSETGGRLLSFNVHEGDALTQGQIVGAVDAKTVALQKEQIEATIASLNEKTSDVTPQIQLLRKQLGVQQEQLSNLLHEKDRTERLVKADAAAGKQLDDINYQVDVLRKQIAVTQQQIAVQKNNTATQNRSILSEGKPLVKQAAQLEEQLAKSKISNPINGVVLTTYAENGELMSPGKALYRIADVSQLNLRAYITGTQLAQVKLGQSVTVLVDKGEEDYRRYSGSIYWISDKAEFTPKTIQTKEERANLVYAIKIRVKNDGYLKIGMFGEVLLNNSK